MEEKVISDETQKIIAAKLSRDQLFILVVLAMTCLMLYLLTDKLSSRIDKLIDLTEQNLTLSKDLIMRWK